MWKPVSLSFPFFKNLKIISWKAFEHESKSAQAETLKC